MIRSSKCASSVLRNTQFHRTPVRGIFSLPPDKSLPMTPELNAYLDKYGMRTSHHLGKLYTHSIQHTGHRARNILQPISAAFLGWQAKQMKAKRVLEVGTFTGCTTLALAEAVAQTVTAENTQNSSKPYSHLVRKAPEQPADLQKHFLVGSMDELIQSHQPNSPLVLTLERDLPTSSIAFAHWRDALHHHGLAVAHPGKNKAVPNQSNVMLDLIRLMHGDATESLKQLTDPAHELCRTFDLIFVDAEKRHYLDYWELGLQLLRKGGVIAVDNVLWRGQVASMMAGGGSHGHGNVNGSANGSGGNVNGTGPGAMEEVEENSKRGAKSIKHPQQVLMQQQLQQQQQQQQSAASLLQDASAADAGRSDKQAKLVHEFNMKVHADNRVDSCILPLGDGLTVAIKR